MLNNGSFTPYFETKFVYDKNNSKLSVENPWVNILVDVDDEQKDNVESIVKKLEDRNKIYTDVKTQEFLRFFSDLPILHIVPRNLDKSQKYASSGDEIVNAQGPLQFMKTVNIFNDVDIDRDLFYVPTKWEWDYEEIAKEAAIPGTDLYDPFSVYTALRRKRLLFQMDHANNAHKLIKYLNELKVVDEDKFFSAMAIVLSQQYYVTGECHAVLDPASNSLTLIKDEIIAYAKEELNHDRLILRSINKLSDIKPENFVYMPEVKVEIEVIKYAGYKCALGFSALVSIMEGTVYPETDPVGDILRNSSRPDSHKGVEAHFQINKNGNHTAIPEIFVSKIPAVTKETIMIACRLTECTIRLDAGLAGSLHRYLLANGYAI